MTTAALLLAAAAIAQEPVQLQDAPSTSPVPLQLPRAESAPERVQFAPPALPVGVDPAFASLAARLEERINGMHWGEGQLSILVQDAQAPVTVYARDPEKLMQPGALVQLFTAVAALERLPADFTFKTEFGVSGSVDNKTRTLDGGVVIRSDGDPTISSQYLGRGGVLDLLDEWTERLRDEKIRTVTGSVAGDARAFEAQLLPPGWALERLGAGDLPSISALNLNHNVFEIDWQAGKKEGQPANFAIFPPPGDYFYFAPHVVVRERPARARVITRVDDGNLVSAGGDLGLRTKATDRAAVEDPARYFADVLRRRMIHRKIEVQGPSVSTRTLEPDAMPAMERVLATRVSPPIDEIVRFMLANDSTLEAEVIFKTLGRKMDAAGEGSFAGGRAALQEFINRELRLPGQRIIVDGSGRSSMNRLSARHVVELLRRMSERPAGARLQAAMPQGGEEGILRQRFQPAAMAEEGESGNEVKKKDRERKAPAAAVRAMAASGDGVEALAGWVDSGFGRRMSFAMIVNGSKAPAGLLQRQLDALVIELSGTGIGQ